MIRETGMARLLAEFLLRTLWVFSSARIHRGNVPSMVVILTPDGETESDMTFAEIKTDLPSTIASVD